MSQAMNAKKPIDSVLSSFRNKGNMSVVTLVGLKYIGLPLVVELGRNMEAIGFDLSARLKMA